MLRPGGRHVGIIKLLSLCSLINSNNVSIHLFNILNSKVTVIKGRLGDNDTILFIVHECWPHGGAATIEERQRNLRRSRDDVIVCAGSAQGGRFQINKTNHPSILEVCC